ncbi:MAG: hypothetical protein OEX08_01930 [Candidatus Nomurabacteria bacterium]|nr:hypothetical protein [Candidatus Nomurabacteria bacterium]
MKILVIDDNPQNIQAAEEQLGADHELTLCSSYDEAQEYLTQVEGDVQYHAKRGDSYFAHFWEKGDPWFDVVLTDLFMPPSSSGQGSTEAGQVPYGFVFALAALRRGTKNVAIVTDGNHHDSPLLWAMDLIGFSDSESSIAFNSSTFITCSSMIWDGNQYTVKDWKKALERLLK